MIKYIMGLLRNLFNPAVSLLAKIDCYSRISRKAKVYGSVQVSNSTIDDYSYVGRRARVVYADIGKFCSIAGDVKLGMGTHTLDRLSTSPIFTERHNSTRHQWAEDSLVEPYKRVSVGNDVWIGTDAIIMGGVSIGNGAVIGAGAIVTKDIPAYAIAVGVPARVIRYRFSSDVIDKLESLKWWDLPDNILKENIALFQSLQTEESIIALSKFFDNHQCGKRL